MRSASELIGGCGHTLLFHVIEQIVYDIMEHLWLTARYVGRCTLEKYEHLRSGHTGVGRLSRERGICERKQKCAASENSGKKSHNSLPHQISFAVHPSVSKT